MLAPRNEMCGEGANPIVDRTWVNADAALGQPLGHVSVAEAVTQRVANRKGDHVIREPVPAEGGARARGAASTAGRTSIDLTSVPLPPRLHPEGTRLLAGALTTLHLGPCLQ